VNPLLTSIHQTNYNNLKRPNLDKVLSLYFCFKKSKHSQGFNSQSENPLEDVRTHFLHFSTFVKMHLNPKTSFFGPFPFLQLNFGHKPKVNVMTSNISFVILGNLKPINMPKYLTSWTLKIHFNSPSLFQFMIINVVKAQITFQIWTN